MSSSHEIFSNFVFTFTVVRNSADLLLFIYLLCSFVSATLVKILLIFYVLCRKSFADSSNKMIKIAYVKREREEQSNSYSSQNEEDDDNAHLGDNERINSLMTRVY